MSDLSPYLPEDFDEFWLEAYEEAKTEPLDYHRSLKNEFDLPGFTVELITFRGITGQALKGWIAFPEGARRLPSFLWIPPYGRESLLPNAYGTRSGMTSLSFNLHGLDAFHQEKYVVERGYFTEGLQSPRTYIYRRLIQHCIIAARVLQAQIEVDEDRIGAMGMSQGGGMAIWLGFLSPIVKAVAADMPFFGGLRYALNRNAHRYPLKEIIDFRENEPLGEQVVPYTLSYFDTVNMATHCQKPTLISQGLKDPAVRPETAQAIYEALPGPKKLITYDWGHDWHPDMITNNQSWLLENM